MEGTRPHLSISSSTPDRPVSQIAGVQGGGGHVGLVASLGEQGLGRVLGLLRLLLAVNQLGQLKGQDLLGLVQLLILPGAHLVNLLQRQESEHPDALHYVGIIHIAPVLVEVEGIGFIGIQPNGVASGLPFFCRWSR